MLLVRLSVDVQAGSVGQAVVAGLRVLEAYEGEHGPVEDLSIRVPVQVGLSEGLWRVRMTGLVRPRTVESETVVVAGMGGRPDIPAMTRRGLETSCPALSRVA